MVFVTHCIAQQIYFNNRYDYKIGLETARNVLEIDSGYIIVGGGYGAGIFSYIGILIIRIGFNGDTVWKKFYGQPGYAYYHGGGGSMVKTNDGGYALGGAITDTSGNTNVLLVKFNNTDDTIWTKIYSDSNFFASSQCKQTIDGGYVLVGAITKPGPNSDIFLIKTDSLGNLQWQRTYGVNFRHESGNSVYVTNDGGYILCGSRRQSIGIYSDVYIIKTDSAGNEQWSRIFGGAYRDGAGSIIQTSDSAYVFCGYYTYNQPTSLTFHSKIWVVKLDNTGATIWDKKYGPLRKWAGLSYIVELSDGSFISSGQRYDTSSISDASIGHLVGLVTKIGANGDSIWYRMYNILQGQYGQSYLSHIQQTKDRGYIATGFVMPQSPDTGNQDTWVIKIDSCGCAYAGCDTVCTSNTSNCNLIEALIYTLADTFKIADTVQFFDSSVLSDQWYWDFGDGTTDTIQHPFHTYDSAGDYTVTLIINDGSCTDTATTIITILNNVGIKDSIKRNNNFLYIYPNPSISTAFISIFINVKDPFDSKFIIYDITGRKIKDYRLKKKQRKLIILTNDIGSGIFFLQWLSENEILKTEKIVIFE